MLWLTLKASVILVAAFGAAHLLRRAPAAIRHFTWTVAFLALLVLPAVVRIGPKWGPTLSAPAPTSSVAMNVSASQPAPAPPAPASRPDMLATLRLVGIGATALWFLVGWLRTSRIVDGAAPAAYARAALAELRAALAIRRADVLESAAVPMPLTWGILHPIVLLPAGAAEWPEARLRTVLLHELVHIQRRDVLSQTVAQLACCLFWFHPLVWLAARRLRQERERACDDAVLRYGVSAPDYAGHLMDLVRALADRRAAMPDAPAMAEVSDLESRVRALLDRGRNRSPLSRRAAMAVAAGALAVLLPLASVTARAQGARGSLTGVVEDPTGARIPNARVVAKNLDGGNEEVAIADPAGQYRFSSIAAGRYTLEFRVPGFAVAKVNDIALISGGAVTVDGRLELGQVNEAVTVRASRTSAPRAQPATGTPQRIRVGGNVQAMKLLRQPKPVYPEELKQAGVHGTVMIRAIISKQGEPLNLKVINTDIDPRLAQAALDAVRQWLYTPTLLNGEPVETMTNIEVTYELSQ